MTSLNNSRLYSLKPSIRYGRTMGDVEAEFSAAHADPEFGLGHLVTDELVKVPSDLTSDLRPTITHIGTPADIDADRASAKAFLEHYGVEP